MPTPRKLTDQQRKDISGFLADRTYTAVQLAAMYGVTDTTIRTMLPDDRRRGPRPEPHSLAGRRFGKWRVLGRSLERNNRVNRHTYWRCRCTCGAVHTVQGTALVTGKSRQCIDCRARNNRGRPKVKKA